MIFAAKTDLCEIDVFVLLAFCHQSLRRCPSKRGPSSQASHLCFGFSAHLLGRFYPQDRVANVSGWVGKGHEPAAAGSTSSGRVGWIWHRYWGEVFGACIYSWSPLFHQYAWSGLHGLVLCSIDSKIWLQETVAATVNSPHQLVIPRFQEPFSCSSLAAQEAWRASKAPWVTCSNENFDPPAPWRPWRMQMRATLLSVPQWVFLCCWCEWLFLVKSC